MLLLTFFIYLSPILRKSEIKKTVKKLYESVYPESSVEIIGMNDEGHLYRLLLKIITSRSSSYLEVYITKDGKFLSESGNMVSVKEYLNKMEKLKNFVECLFNKNVRIFGATNTSIPEINAATQLQLDMLGKYAAKIYVSCDGDMLQQCINIGLTSLPAVVYQNKAYYGVFTPELISNITGCKF